MYVILNTHHETEWLIPTEEKYPEVSQKLKAIWTQIATYFKDYSDYLIFEGMNEPRVVGGENEWNGGTEENRLVINKLNRDFIDAVRTTGGNNTTRLCSSPPKPLLQHPSQQAILNFRKMNIMLFLFMRIPPISLPLKPEKLPNCLNGTVPKVKTSTLRLKISKGSF